MRVFPALLTLPLVALAACGGSPASPSETTDTRFDPIVGGVQDNSTSHEAVVMVYNAQVGAMCTGTLVSQDGEKGVVITARHCVSEVVSEYVTCGKDVADDYQPSDIYILRGSNPAHSNDGYLAVGEKIFHTEGTSLCNADFAVIVTQEAISGIMPLRVRTNPDAYSNGEQFTAIGYGLTNPSNDYSSGRRYLREDVTLTALGPHTGGVFSKEFLGTASICSGDSGGPAVSANWAVIGVTSRGATCWGDNNIWTRVDSFKDTLDEAMAYAGSTYVVEDGAPPWPDDVDAGELGAGGSGGSGTAEGTGGMTAIGGSAGSVIPAEPPCGESGPCLGASKCVTDPASGQSQCVAMCSSQLPCTNGSECDLQAGLCVTPPARAAAMDDGVTATGGCSTSPGSAPRGVGVGLFGALAWLLLRRKNR